MMLHQAFEDAVKERLISAKYRAEILKQKRPKELSRRNSSGLFCFFFQNTKE